MNSKNMIIDKDHSIETLNDTIVSFIYEKIIKIDSYEEEYQIYVLHEIPVIMDASIRRTEKIIFVNVTIKRVDLDAYQFEDGKLSFSDEGVCVNTFILLRHLQDENKIDHFIEKISLKIDEVIHTVTKNSNVTKFDIVNQETIKFFERFKGYGKRAIADTSVHTIQKYESKELSQYFMEDVLHSIFNDAISNIKTIKIFHIYFNGLIINEDLSTNFTMPIVFYKDEDTEKSLWVLIDLTNSDQDRKDVGFDKTKIFHYGVSLLGKTTPERNMLNVHRFDYQYIYDDMEYVIEKVADTLLSCIDLLTDDPIVKNITITKKEI